MKLVFATHNQHKLKEIQALLPKNIELLSLSDIGCDDDIAETATTIEGNALLKAQYIKDRLRSTGTKQCSWGIFGTVCR